MQNSVFFSFLVYTESEHTITTNPHIVKGNLGIFTKKTGGNSQKSATYKNSTNDNFFISTTDTTLHLQLSIYCDTQNQ